MRPPMEALRPMFPFAAFMLISFYWVYRSPNDIINKDPRALYLLTGTIFSNISVSIQSLPLPHSSGMEITCVFF
jgi:ethanolaminephosphotransferase